MIHRASRPSRGRLSCGACSRGSHLSPLLLLLGSIALAAEVPPPPAATGPDEPPPAPPEAVRPAEGSPLGPVFVGGEVLLPRKRSGRLLEQPVAVVIEGGRRLGGPLEGGLHLSLGYAQLSRTVRCGGAYVFCEPMLSVAAGGVLRLTTPPGGAVVGWLGLGAGISGAINWDLSAPGGYLRADAGVDLPAGRRRVRLSVGWIGAAYTEDRSELEPGRQRYLAFTVLIGPR